MRRRRAVDARRRSSGSWTAPARARVRTWKELVAGNLPILGCSSTNGVQGCTRLGWDRVLEGTPSRGTAGWEIAGTLPEGCWLDFERDVEEHSLSWNGRRRLAPGSSSARARTNSPESSQTGKGRHPERKTGWRVGRCLVEER